MTPKNGGPTTTSGRGGAGPGHSTSGQDDASRNSPQSAASQRTNISGITPFYRAIAVALERRRLALALPQEKFSEFAGLPDRSYSKYVISPDSPSGRQATWPTVQRIVDVLFPDGFELSIKARRGPAMDALGAKFATRYDKLLSDGRTRREILSEFGRLGAQTRWKNSTSEQRKRFARKGGRARARKLSDVDRARLAKHASRIRSRKAAQRRRECNSGGANQ